MLTGLVLLYAASGGAAELDVEQGRDTGEVRVLCGDKVCLQSPTEGLWSVSMGWQDDWPSDWRHAHVSEVEKVGDWTILRGEIETRQGRWQVSDSYLPRDGVVKCVRRFVWEGKQVAKRCTLSVRFQCPGTGAGVVAPGILYHGNPSGARSGRTPVYTGAPGEEAIYEEHRFPMPYVSFEWKDGGAYRGAALHTLPSPAPCANLADQWWSLGLVARDGATEFTLLSGPCASNGKRSVVKAIQPGFMPLPDCYLNVPSGAIVEKTFYLQAYPVEQEGSGFRTATRKSLALNPPCVTPDLPTFHDIIQAKYRFAKTRWHESPHGAGFRKYTNKNFFVLGWCGQASALGYALQVLSPDLDDPPVKEMVQRSLDAMSGAEFYEGGFHTWFNADDGTWSREEPLSQGQGMLCFANAIRVAKGSSYDTAKWRAFLRKACGFHAKRILAPDWNPNSTDEAFFIAPLCEGYGLFSVKAYRDAAIKAGETYARRSLTMREPYWGGTLDASCEDKEGAFAALQGFLALHDLTGEAKFLDWAGHACDVAITYTVLWDIDLPPGRLRDHGFKTRGWTAVSAQNQHIDVYGVLIAPLVYRVGELSSRDDLKELALLMYRSCGQLIDPHGSQGEQPQHTNYAQRGKLDAVAGLRGGYVEDWTVFWITAHFLNAAAQFREMGVDVDR